MTDHATAEDAARAMGWRKPDPEFPVWHQEFRHGGGGRIVAADLTDPAFCWAMLTWLWQYATGDNYPPEVLMRCDEHDKEGATDWPQALADAVCAAAKETT